MTCIVGIEFEGRVLIGGDSAASDGSTITTRADAKVFARDGYAIGFTTSWRMGQLLRYVAALPPMPASGDLDAFMVSEFVPAVRQAFTEGGFAGDDKADKGGTFMVGVRGRLYRVCDDFQIGRNKRGYDACGSGEYVALGAMHAVSRFGYSPRGVLTCGLRAAEEWAVGIRGPFRFVEAA